MHRHGMEHHGTLGHRTVCGSPFESALQYVVRACLLVNQEVAGAPVQVGPELLDTVRQHRSHGLTAHRDIVFDPETGVWFNATRIGEWARGMTQPSRAMPTDEGVSSTMAITLLENFRAVFYTPFYAAFALKAYEAEGVE